MKVLVPLYAFGPMGHAMFNASVDAAVLERIADGWLVEFIAPADRAAFIAALHKIGVKPLQVPRDTATGRQGGTEPVT